MGKRIIAQRKGKGSIYRAPSHRYKADVVYPAVDNAVGIVIDLVHDPGHTTPLARIRLNNGLTSYILPPETLRLHQTISIGKGDIKPGNILRLSDIPEGTSIFNIEGRPGDGGKFVRAGGTSAMLMGKGKKITVQMPSKKLKNFDPKCRATIGTVAGGGRPAKPFGKAGKKCHVLRSKAKVHLHVSGVAMNPVDHPHGGGGHQHIGKPSSVRRDAPPGRKAGHIAPRRTGKVK